MLENVKIRQLESKDIPLLADVFSPSKEKWFRYLQEQATKLRTTCLVEELDTITGYGTLLRASEYPSFRNKQIPEISDIWIDEQKRGKGLGTLLITHLEQLARDEVFEQVGIGVGLYQDYGPAQKLYFRLGYIPNGYGPSLSILSSNAR